MLVHIVKPWWTPEACIGLRLHFSTPKTTLRLTASPVVCLWWQRRDIVTDFSLFIGVESSQTVGNLSGAIHGWNVGFSCVRGFQRA
jgi:hypothetical protein